MGYPPQALTHGVQVSKWCRYQSPTQAQGCDARSSNSLWAQDPRAQSEQKAAGENIAPKEHLLARELAATGLRPHASINTEQWLLFTQTHPIVQKHNIAVLGGLEPRLQSFPVNCTTHSTSTEGLYQIVLGRGMLCPNTSCGR